jgi:hypothetical protein
MNLSEFGLHGFAGINGLRGVAKTREAFENTIEDARPENHVTLP